MIHKTLRPAIAMIELIFAIVIMGITLLSAPLIMNMSTQSSTVAMQQESIAAASSQISLILTHPWDEGDSNATSGYGILNVTDEDTELAPAVRLSLATRPFIKRRYNVAPQETNASLPATFGETGDNIPENDIDDFHNVIKTVKFYNATYETSVLTDDEGEYLKGTNFEISTAVQYASDSANYSTEGFEFNTPFSTAAANASSNIKLISVTLTNTGALTDIKEHKQAVTLRAFSCNVGSSFNNGADRVSMP